MAVLPCDVPLLRALRLTPPAAVTVTSTPRLNAGILLRSRISCGVLRSVRESRNHRSLEHDSPSLYYRHWRLPWWKAASFAAYSRERHRRCTAEATRGGNLRLAKPPNYPHPGVHGQCYVSQVTLTGDGSRYSSYLVALIPDRA